MPRLIWTDRALSDMQRLYRFLVAKDKGAARRALATIRRAVAPLATHPGLGQPVPRLGLEYRRLVIGFGESGYVLFYRLDGELTTLLSLRHQKELDDENGEDMSTSN